MANNKRTVDYYRQCLINHISRKIISGQFELDVLSNRDITGYAKCNLILKDDETLGMSVNKDYIVIYSIYSFANDIKQEAIDIICKEVSKKLGENI